MATLFMSYEVEDFDRWRRAFDDHERMRTESGARSHRIFRDPDDDHRVTVVVEVEGSDNAKELLAAHESADLWKRSGVKGKPRTWVAEAFEDVTYPRETRRDAILEQAEVIL